MKILYFAWLRERLNRGEEEVSPPPGVSTVAELIGWLAARDESAAAAFRKPELIRAAINARLAGPDASIVGAHTVALFPPMTGG